MRAFLLRLDGTATTARQALGAVACASVRDATGKRLFGKGHVVTAADLPALEARAGIDVPLLALDPGDAHEDEAAIIVGRAAAGPGVDVQGPTGARARLVAAHNGLLEVDAPALAALNSIDGVSVYTLFGGQPVKAGTQIGEAKVTPLAVPRQAIEQIEAAAAGAVAVHAFVPLRVSLLVRERLEQPQAERFVEALRKKLSWFGSSVLDAWYVMPETPAPTVASMMRKLLDAGADALIVTGGSSANPFDPLLLALEHLPATAVRVGVPTHPGSMLWVAYAHSPHAPTIGVPSCGMFSEATAFDLIVPLLCANRELTAQRLAALGHGGLLHGADWRFARYEE